MKPSDFYKTDRYQYGYINDPKSIYVLIEHIHEIDYLEIEYDRNNRIECRIYYDPYIDGERCCTVGAAFLDGKPVMIFRHAGRGGRDYSDEYITDADLYKEMVEYLKTLASTPIPDQQVYSPDEEIPELDVFYNHQIVIGLGLRNTT